MIKTILALASALVIMAVTGGATFRAVSPKPPPESACGEALSNLPSPLRVNGDYYKIVRAEYVSISGNIGTLRTTCCITNTSLSPITLLNVYVLGPNGVNSLLGSYTGFVGTTLPGLGQRRLVIDNTSIPGLLLETAEGGSGVKSVIFGWTGPSDALNVTAVIERLDGGNTSGRAWSTEVGVPLLP